LGIACQVEVVVFDVAEMMMMLIQGEYNLMTLVFDLSFKAYLTYKLILRFLKGFGEKEKWFVVVAV
jgi:hypothetical protein